MYKTKIIFLLLLFFTQSVLAGVDLHYHSEINGIVVNQSTDIIEHYIDVHYTVKNSVQDDNSLDASDSMNHANHHHECHGHSTLFSFFVSNSNDLTFTVFYSQFHYTLNDYFTNLTFPKRPPIHV